MKKEHYYRLTRRQEQPESKKGPGLRYSMEPEKSGGTENQELADPLQDTSGGCHEIVLNRKNQPLLLRRKGGFVDFLKRD